MWGDPNLSYAMVAIGTLLLAAVTAFSIDNTRQQEKRRIKENLLNEIIEWATNIAKCESESEMTAIPASELRGVGKGTQEQIVGYVHRVERANLMLRYQAADARSEYIKAIASKFEHNLHSAARQTANKLAKYITLLRKNLEGQATEEECGKQWHSLIKTALDVTKKAAKIKTSDIG